MKHQAVRLLAAVVFAIALAACEPMAEPQVAATVLPAETIAGLSVATAPTGSTWRGLAIAVESRCSDYEASDYSYPQSVEPQVAANLGGWWSPYDGATFTNQESDIEHIVARSEAHDSGLCATDADTRERFAEDLDNLTLATPALNRYQKGSKDAAEWQPQLNVCWFAGRVLAVRLEYGLTVDRSEAYALEGMLAGCRLEDVLRPTKPPEE